MAYLPIIRAITVDMTKVAGPTIARWFDPTAGTFSTIEGSHPPFDFLGFTHAWGNSRNGKDVVRQTTAKSRFARSLAAVKDWCRTNRHRTAPEQRARLSAALVGHYAYYGITGNIRRLQGYRYQVVRIWQNWLERRTRGWLLTGASFNAFLARHPLPAARIIHRYTSWNEALS